MNYKQLGEKVERLYDALESVEEHVPSGLEPLVQELLAALDEVRDELLIPDDDEGLRDEIDELDSFGEEDLNG